MRSIGTSRHAGRIGFGFLAPGGDLQSHEGPWGITHGSVQRDRLAHRRSGRWRRSFARGRQLRTQRKLGLRGASDGRRDDHLLELRESENHGRTTRCKKRAVPPTDVHLQGHLVFPGEALRIASRRVVRNIAA